MSQHLRISGSSARSMCPIHVLAFMSQHLCISGSSARSMCPDPCLNIHMYLRNLCKIHVSGSVYKHSYVCQALCKIHVSGSVYKHPFVSQDPLRDPYLRIHVSTSTCISGTSARSMSPDPYISIRMYLRILCKNHVSDSCLSIYVSQAPLQDPCLRIRI